MNKLEINPVESMTIEKLAYPKEEIEHLVTQILKLANEKQNSAIYSHHIDNAIEHLTNMLGLLSKPVLLMKEHNHD